MAGDRQRTLTPLEARALGREQARISHMEARMSYDGGSALGSGCGWNGNRTGKPAYLVDEHNRY